MSDGAKIINKDIFEVKDKKDGGLIKVTILLTEDDVYVDISKEGSFFKGCLISLDDK